MRDAHSVCSTWTRVRYLISSIYRRRHTAQPVPTNLIAATIKFNLSERTICSALASLLLLSNFFNLLPDKFWLRKAVKGTEKCTRFVFNLMEWNSNCSLFQPNACQTRDNSCVSHAGDTWWIFVVNYGKSVEKKFHARDTWYGNEWMWLIASVDGICVFSLRKFFQFRRLDMRFKIDNNFGIYSKKENQLISAE